MQLVRDLLGEVILCTKEVNRGTQAEAGQLLLEMCRQSLHPDPEAWRQLTGDLRPGGYGQQRPRDDATGFFGMVAGGLAGASPHMMAAALEALRVLLAPYRNRLRPAFVAQLMAATTRLLQLRNREVSRACLELLKAALATLPRAALQPALPGLVEALLATQSEAQLHFRPTVRLLLERILKKFGYDALAALVPEGDHHVKLLANLRKGLARNQRRREVGGDGKPTQQSRTVLLPDDPEAPFDLLGPQPHSNLYGTNAFSSAAWLVLSGQ